MKKKLKLKRQRTSDNFLENERSEKKKSKQVSWKRNIEENEFLGEKEYKEDQVKEKKSKHRELNQSKVANLWSDGHLEKESNERSEKKNDKLQKKGGLIQDKENTKVQKKLKEKSKVKRGELDVIDDGDASFVELISVNSMKDTEQGSQKRVSDKASQVANSGGGIVTFQAKRKKANTLGPDSLLQSFLAVEVGIGGPSSWGDE